MHLEFWYDLACPQAYLAFTQVEALAGHHDARITWRPVRQAELEALWEVPKAPPNAVRQAVDWVDVRRWADWYGVPLVPPRAPPEDPGLPMRVMAAATDERPAVTRVLYEAAWGQGTDLTRPGPLKAVLAAAGLDADGLLARADSEEARTSLTANAQEGHRRGIFGVPSFVVEDQLFWGQDRLSFVARALAGWTVDFVADEDKELS